MAVSINDVRSRSKEYQDFCADSDEVTLRRPQEGKSLELTVNGRHYEVSRVASAFPLSNSMDTVVFFDDSGDEIGCMKRVKSLDTQSRGLLNGELEKSYFMPRIQTVLSMEESLGIELWTVVTNKGTREFQLRSPRTNIRHLPNGRVLVKDVDGNRYEIRNWRHMDRRSIHLLMRHL